MWAAAVVFSFVRLSYTSHPMFDTFLYGIRLFARDFGTLALLASVSRSRVGDRFEWRPIILLPAAVLLLALGYFVASNAGWCHVGYPSDLYIGGLVTCLQHACFAIAFFCVPFTMRAQTPVLGQTRMKMTVDEVLFSFSGRMSRSDYWWIAIVPSLVLAIVNIGLTDAQLALLPDPACHLVAVPCDGAQTPP